jgi:hypothetical protein
MNTRCQTVSTHSLEVNKQKKSSPQAVILLLSVQILSK